LEGWLYGFLTGRGLEREKTDELQARLADLELQSAAEFGRIARFLRGWKTIPIRLAGLK
jgi:hypothetical protein